MADGDASKIQVKAPTVRSGDYNIEGTGGSSTSENAKVPRQQYFSLVKQRKPKNVRVESPQRQHHPGHQIYLGSYAHSTPSSLQGSLDAATPRHSPVPSPRASTSHLQLQHLLKSVDVDLERYGVEELRDGFFDASFYPPLPRKHEDLMKKATRTLPDSFKKHPPLSIQQFLSQQSRETRAFFRRVTTTRAGVKLLKSFLGFFIAYIICFIPASRDWLGRYNYILCISALINHPGRAVGSQIDGAVFTLLGTVAGLAWGSLALYVSTSTSTARTGYGGVLATFLVIFTTLIGWLRSVYIRFYQGVIAAGIAIFYTCLANTSETVGWRKVFDYGIPWVLGQVICLLVAVLVLPDAGARLITLALRESFESIQAGLVLPRENRSSLKRRLAWQFVNISQAVRDFTIEATVSRFPPDDVTTLRNMVQGVIRSILSIRPETTLFEELDAPEERPDTSVNALEDGQTVNLICKSLQSPTRELINAMSESVKQADKTILSLGVPSPTDISYDLSAALDRLQTAKKSFDHADAVLITDPKLPSTYTKSPDVVELFLFIHPVRQTADKVESLIAHVFQMAADNKGWKLRPPSYPVSKAIMRTNAQVRHDRGGLTAGFYFRTKEELDKSMAELQTTTYIPAASHELAETQDGHLPAISEYQQEQHIASGKLKGISKAAKFRYRLWSVLHRLQGFESRFALKVTLTTTLLSVPAWLPQSRTWWNTNESWWAVVTVWIMMHPRVGGTFQDLFVRSFCAALGAIWGGLAHAAGNGNPYVLAIFSALYMIPMLYRYTQSSHPRSGVIGCISYTVVSLSAYTAGPHPPVLLIAWTRGLAIVVGVIAALITNWLLWPFIARRELRKSLSATLLHSALLYRSIIAKYIYYPPSLPPSASDIARSEMLEGRLREGFVRMRQLMELTRHEMRLRAPFDARPYSALIATCEALFEHLVQVRQSAVYFQPGMLAAADDEAAMARLTAPRRDAVAVILMNLYVLACALRANQAVPRYLPSAAAARRRLLDRMEEVEGEEGGMEKEGEGGKEKEKMGKVASGSGNAEGVRGRRWRDVYRVAFDGALTEIVEELGMLQAFTKEVVGEVGWG